VFLILLHWAHTRSFLTAPQLLLTAQIRFPNNTDMGKMNHTDQESEHFALPEYARPELPPPPYFREHFVSPSSFKAAIHKKLDNPLTSLFRLSFRILQFAFALASGISYAIELSHGNVSHPTTFIYAQVVFGLTLLTLVMDSTMIPTYRFTWIVEWVLVILWFASFAVFYEAYLAGMVEQDYQGGNLGRMERAVWCDLINALLWFDSAIFSSAMCCTGNKAAIKNKLDKRRPRKGKKPAMQKISKMESGLRGASSK
jgi:hypothetical protein